MPAQSSNRPPATDQATHSQHHQRHGGEQEPHPGDSPSDTSRTRLRTPVKRQRQDDKHTTSHDEESHRKSGFRIAVASVRISCPGIFRRAQYRDYYSQEGTAARRLGTVLANYPQLCDWLVTPGCSDGVWRIPLGVVAA